MIPLRAEEYELHCSGCWVVWRSEEERRRNFELFHKFYRQIDTVSSGVFDCSVIKFNGTVKSQEESLRLIQMPVVLHALQRRMTQLLLNFSLKTSQTSEE
ncbi:hypothetical protein SRHO_G00129900 [Serrasalmus rhombeus]